MGTHNIYFLYRNNKHYPRNITKYSSLSYKLTMPDHGEMVPNPTGIMIEHGRTIYFVHELSRPRSACTSELALDSSISRFFEMNSEAPD